MDTPRPTDGDPKEDRRPLADLCDAPMEPGRFLEFAIAISLALAELHVRNLAHRNLTPYTILVDPETLAVTLDGRTWLQGPGQQISPPFLSPEQTGRLNRSVDLRSDLYSLGVIFYRMLTGALPFTADNLLDWVHAHIARIPRPPREIIAELPQVLSDLVLKLLAKNAEERYQCARALVADLTACRESWRHTGVMLPFALGEADVADRLQLPQKVYGRERERALLTEAFERVAELGRTEMVVVAGYSGIGKTSLGRELHQEILGRGGYFAWGKTEEERPELPYSSLAGAMRELITLILMEKEERLAQWRWRLTEALGESAQLLVPLVPELALVIGQNPGPQSLSPGEEVGRFALVVGRFFGLFGTKEHPLVLFLDDLQWVDPWTLKVIMQVLAPGEPGHLLLIGAYRSNEIEVGHPLLVALDAIRSETPVLTIELQPLPLPAVHRLLQDTYQRAGFPLDDLALLLMEKTAGNPFFLKQFLTSLHDNGLIWRDRKERRWEWNPEGIRSRPQADNVADLVVQRLQKLEPDVMGILRVAACIGYQFVVPTLAAVSLKPEAEIRDILDRGVGEGVLLPAGAGYSFVHDRVREAAYQSIPESEREVLHLEIGRRLLELTSAESEPELSDAVWHLNLGKHLIWDSEERALVARLNLEVGRKAKLTVAYRNAREYFGSGIRLLGPRPWMRQDRLCFNLFLELSRSLFLDGEPVRARALFPLLLKRAATDLERLAVYGVVIDAQTTLGEDQLAIATILECLALFGIELPARPSDAEVEAGVQEAWDRLGSRSIEDLVQLPLQDDPAQRGALDVLARLYAVAYHEDNNLFYLHLALGVGLSLAHGIAPASVHFFGWFGLMLSERYHQPREGYRFTRMAFELMERHHFMEYRAKALFVLRIISYWTQPMDRMVQYSRAAFFAAVQSGDLPIACYSCNHTSMGLLIRGDHLSEVQQEVEFGLDFLRVTGYTGLYRTMLCLHRAVDALRGRPLGPDDCEDQPEEGSLPHPAPDRIPTLTFYRQVAHLMVHYHLEEYPEAVAAGARGGELVWSGLFSMQSECWNLFYPLALAARIDAYAEQRREEVVQLMATHLERLKEWEQSSPATFHPRCALLGAELARCRGRFEEAMSLYEEATRTARDNGFLPTQALGLELAGRFYRDRGVSFVADYYLREARSCYRRWGAQGKVAQLDRKYPWLAAGQSDPGANGTVGGIDTLTVVRACQAISGETVLPNLLETLMRMVLQNAGGRRGCLLLTRGEDLLLEAEASVEGDLVQVARRVEAPSDAALPLTLVQYVKRSRQSVILDDSRTPNHFSQDEYLTREKPVSVLCLPILRKETLVGVLYLENNLMPGVFTPERLLVLELLAAQAVISLDNVRASELFKGLLETAPDAMVIIDQNGKIRIVNTQLQLMFGYRKEELVGQPVEMLIPLRYRERHVVDVQGFIQHPRYRPMGVGLELYGLRKNGAEFPVDISLSPLTTDQEGLVTAAIRDVTERKQAEQSIRESEMKYRQLTETLEQRVKESVAELRQKDQILIVQGRQAVMGEMISNIAHQWRQPLNTLGLLAQEIQITYARGEFTAAFVESNIKKTMTIIEHMSRTIDDFRTFFRPDKEKVEFRVAEAVEKALSLLEGTFRAMQVQVELRQQADPVLRGYPSEFSQALVNIFINARDAFTSRKTIEPKIVIELRSEEGRAVLTIADNAGGIPAEIIDKIFEPYFTTKGPDKGTGVGLFMAKTIIEKNMNGSLTVKNAVDGAEFRIEV